MFIAVAQKNLADAEMYFVSLRYSADLVKAEGGVSTRQILAMELDLIQAVNEGCGAVGLEDMKRLFELGNACRIVLWPGYGGSVPSANGRL